MFGSLLGALSSALPGYVQGQRLAVGDNWGDLENYNRVQQGQYANAFTAATWQPRINMFNNASYRDDFNTQAALYNLAQQYAWLPWNLSTAQGFGVAAPRMVPKMITQMMNAWDKVGQYGMFPGAGGLMGGMMGAMSPSNLGG